MLTAWQQHGLAVGIIVLISGCASDIRNMLSGLEQQRGDIELIQTPFYPQVTDQCGPSALAAILNYSGVAVTPDALKARIYIPGRQGSLQIELLAATRGYGRMPYLIDTNISGLLGEVRAGRPVLVLQNLGSKRAPVWHYAVVVGYLADERQFILRSGDQKRYRVKAAKFLRSWQRADYWAVVVLEPGKVPDNVNPETYLRALAGFESANDAAAVIVAYVAAVAKWPQNTLAGLGLGNAYYANGQLDLAQQAYAAVLRVDPQDAIVLNNLAQVLYERGSSSEATDAIAMALSAVDVNGPEYRIILQTQQEISQPGNKPAQ